jgi:hypothetical protein
MIHIVKDFLNGIEEKIESIFIGEVYMHPFNGKKLDKFNNDKVASL